MRRVSCGGFARSLRKTSRAELHGGFDRTAALIRRLRRLFQKTYFTAEKFGYGKPTAGEVSPCRLTVSEFFIFLWVMQDAIVPFYFRRGQAQSRHSPAITHECKPSKCRQVTHRLRGAWDVCRTIISVRRLSGLSDYLYSELRADPRAVAAENTA